jgi:hypothetical protein
MIEITPAEEILAKREACKNSAHGSYGPAPKLDAQQSSLLAPLADLNTAGCRHRSSCSRLVMRRVRPTAT